MGRRITCTLDPPSRFDLYYGEGANFIALPAQWLRAAVWPGRWSGISTASLMPAYVAIVIVSGSAAARLQ